MTDSKDSGTAKAPGFGAFIGSPTNEQTRSKSSDPRSTSESRPARKKRGGRGRSRKAREGVSEKDAPEGETSSAPRKKSGGRRSRGQKAPAADAPLEQDGTFGAGASSDAAPTHEAPGRDSDDGSGSEGRSSTRRRKRGTSRKRRPSAERGAREDGDARDGGADSKAARSDGGEPDGGESDGGESEGKPKRRRRGTRGGRKRKSSPSREKPTAAVLELIPGEDDDLPELPELPAEAELLNADEVEGEEGRGRSRKKRSRRKRAGAESSDVDDAEDESESESKKGRKKASKKKATKKTTKKATRKTAKKAEVVPDRKILVNASDPEEMRVAVVRDGKILDFQMTVDSDTSLVNDIYRGRIVNIEASIGAAFVDFGRGRNGFLHTSDVLPTYAEKGVSLSQLLATSVDPEDWDASSSQPSVAAELGDEEEGEGDAEATDDARDGADPEGGGKSEGSKGGRKPRGGRRSKGEGRGKGRQQRYRARPRRPISELFKVGQKVVVQITKDAIGDKGPTLTTYLSIPGRYLVLMPSISHRGVSRKIEDAKERKRLKRVLDGLDVPEGMGIIARTATQGHTKEEIKRDLDYLLSAWKRLSKRLGQGQGPTALYQESDVAIRTVRDLFGPETEAVIVDEHESYKSIREFAEQLMPEQADRIVEHAGPKPLFHDQGVEQDFEKIFARRIELPSGGSIVFDQAEALVAIDVNSGKTRTSSHDFEEIALKTNLEAVPEIARQIRLRDLGGILVVDFIDMMKNANRKAVEQAFRARFGDDRARSKIGRISQFGLLEMTRQRLGPGINKKVFRPCTICRGLGRERTDASRGSAILRRLGSALTLKGFTKVEVRAHPGTIEYLKRKRRKELTRLEEDSGRKLELKPVPDQVEDSVLRYLRADGREVRPGGRRKR